MPCLVCAMIERRHFCVGCVFEGVVVDAKEEKEGRSDYSTDRIDIFISSGLSPHVLVVSYLWPRTCAVALAHNVHFQAAALEAHLASEQIFGMNTELLKIKKHKEKVCATEKEAIQSAKTAVRNAPNSLYEGIRDKIDKAMRDIKAAKEKKEAEISMLVERERLLRKALGDKADMWE
ncbi:hypothetical protein K505DRAFT_374457 [Melanomma pulvis-pyrius CBS 109.77]|uniref:Uncharacterized protein n=1 Tax=Melanomma pulvis-pyrius CBS 109.77 TaxID=1314802 RepID=A0A6A6XG98_9PLEO|nr:hypothetical protein K505DRAFT_374457 [Melanomma pulvis-pyrius CBS 109.77]